MGAGRWDKFAAADSEIMHSVPRLRRVRDIIVLHRDLKINAATARVLALAQADDALFRTVVPPFLRHWSGAGDKIHLPEIAHAIEMGQLSESPSWRFGVTPVPRLGAPKRTAYFFEMRHIIVLHDLFKDSAERQKVADGFAQTAGSLNKAFKGALRSLLGKLRAKGALATYPASAGLVKAIFSSTR